MTFGLTLAVVAILSAAYNLVRLYGYEKEKTMAIVRECAENAEILEITSRMESSGKASQAFVRLNAFMELAQQKDSVISARSDTLKTSLASLLHFGLAFSEGKSVTDYDVLDSIFHAELNRHGMNPSFASIKPEGTDPPEHLPLWKTQVRLSPNLYSPSFDIYVSPMPGRVLSHIWGIIIPFCLVTVVFSFLSFYLHSFIKRMKTLERMKDDFTHNMTHELKTPVAVAYSAADSMLRYYDQSDEARNRQFLKIIIQRLGFLSGMIENILSMSMERFKTLNLNLETVPLRTMVEDIAGMIKLKADKPVEINIDIPVTLTVVADSLHLGNVLSNLLDNAVKYSGETVEIRVKADSSSIAISDNGIGIEKEYLPYIFDKFYRVPSGDRYEAGGYGLGLFYVRKIIGLFGWKIDVTSKPRQGTKFIITFKGDEER